jgi:hypothetical protein
MNSHEERRARRLDTAFKLLLAVLVGLWVLYPPQASQPSAAADAVRAAETRR